MNKTLHILTILLLLLGAGPMAFAQGGGDPDPAAETPKRPRVMILGNVYGGGELAQVIAPDAATAEAQLIQDADLADLFTTHADHIYTTYVHLGDSSEVYGRVFGGGKGQHDDLGESAGRVTGQTDVALDGATVWSEIYGGGEMADVRGNTLLHFKKGKAGHNAFGGGLGKLGKREHGNPGDALVELGIEDNLADNRYEPLASADIKKIPAQYSYITDDNAGNLTTLKGLDLNTPDNWMAGKKTGESFVVFDGTEVGGVATYTHYEFKTARTVNRDGSGKPVKVDGLYYTETDQFDADRPEQLFSINHNIYGGGMTASKVEGKTFVHINYGMVNDEMMDFKHTIPGSGEEVPVWSMIYNSIANAQFCVFGGGYGYYTDILGDTNISMDVQGDGQYKYINEFTDWFAGPGKVKYGWDTNVGDPELIYAAADEATWSHGAPRRSCMDIIGGGYNGKVHGATNVTVSGDVVLRKVYGGGYYSSVGETNVLIKSGIFNRVYGGGLIGNVYGKANMTIGQQNTSQPDDELTEQERAEKKSKYDSNLHLLVKDAIYGGNDVSGTVGTTPSGAHTQTNPDNGVTYNVYYPVDDPDHGVRLNIYGGLVLGDVYGAGNGNHPGYGNPNYMQFGYSQHPSENYRKVIEEGQTEITNEHFGHVYKYRPRVGRVVMNLAGNAGVDFNDLPTVDKVRIWGRTFGGGNSCNVGIWDGTEDDHREVYADDGTSWHPGDNYLGGGSIYMNIGSHVQLGNRNDSHETPNGLFMGSNGEHMITQHTDKELAKYYHQYYDSKTKKYYPGFVVYEDDAETPVKRTVGLKAFKAFINTITTKSDNVHLNINNEAQDIWMSNFVGGGYRGSMQAATEDGVFKYTLPEGVTVGHAIVGGAFNAHIIYRVYKTEYRTGEYVLDSDGNYQYETVEPDQGVLSKAEAEAYDEEHGNPKGTTPYDYIKKLYAEGHEGDEAYKTGYLRYNFDGGMLAHDSEMNAAVTGSRIHQVHADPNEEGITPEERVNRFATSYFEPLTEGDGMEDDATKALLFTANKEKALVHLDLRCALQPMVHDTYDPILKTDHTVHGGVVYGGCYATGFIEGDTWVDYGCWLSPLCSGSEYFDKNDNMAIYGDVANLDHVSAMMVFGAGYGADTHSMGDVYVRIKSIAGAGDAGGDSDKFGQFPYIYNAFGGGNMGTVAGNTNVYYASGVQGTLLGSLYGGGYKGRIDGNTFVELAEGFVTNCYGGSRQADIGGASHVWAYDGKYRGVPDAKHLIICNLYGGNDVAGTIHGTMPATWAANKWEESVTDYCESIQGEAFSTYVEISSDDNSADSGFPLIGSVFAGGNGAYDYTSETIDGKANPYYGWSVPTVAKTLLEIDGGSTLRAFGGGNNATVTESVHILTDAHSTHFADVTFAEYQKNIMQKVFFNGQLSGYRWEGTRLRMNDTHVFRLFGGNNLTDMAIQPKWNLQDGHIENVYSGGNMGNMTYYNPAGIMARKNGASDQILGVENLDGTNINAHPKGLSITINSPNIRIGSLFGGCRMSDVRANDARPAGHEGEWQTWPDFEHGGEDCYGATVNVIDGNIGYIFGGNDVSGQVVHGTNINICGGVIGQVYGSGNGDFLYKYIPATPGDDPLYTAAETSDTRITEHLDDEHGLYYTVPENDPEGNPWDNSSTGDTHKIMTINKVRPSVDNTFINIQGMPDTAPVGTPGDPGYKPGKHITLIKGNVYVGGNATTITRGNEEAFSKFKYGSYAVANGLYFGSDGYSYTQDETISRFAQLNGITDMGASTQFKTGHEDDARHNPILLNAYLTAVDMEALPKEFAIPTSGLRETYVGTVCGGGNRGSMLTNRTVDLVIPAQIVVFDKVVAGCNDATINYNQGGQTIKSVGGYTRPIEDHATYGNTKIRYNIAAQFVPLTLDVPMGADLKVPVNRTDLNDHDETWADAIQHAFLWPRLNSAGNAYTTGCNIYGGCYSSGEMEGDVELNIHSNMLRYANEEKLQKAIANGEACFNVFGAGFGQDSHVWGNVHIKMDKTDNVRLVQPELSPVAAELLTSPYLDGQNHITTYDTPSVNNIFGGGRNGQLIGNTTLEVRNGRVYTDVVGGCYASNMYGSSQVIVGYPTYYRCKRSGEYSLQRGDQWNTSQSVIKRSVKYLKGDLVPQNVYAQIVAHTAGNAADFDPVHEVPADWSAVNIQIGKGVYGGGYSLANSTAASAGTITTNKLQDSTIDGALHPMNFDGRYGIDDIPSTEGYGGNSSIMVGDVAGAGSGDHIQISTLYDGGIYGDGHLTFCAGFRAADITGYGYNTGSPATPRLLNTFQRLDLVDINDCCLLLEGAQDFATDKIDATIYSATRINELRMNSTIDAGSNYAALSNPDGTAAPGFSAAKVRNYVGFNNNVHYLGAIVTNDDFNTTPYHTSAGEYSSVQTYKTFKEFHINYYDVSVDVFKQRNLGTARNCIGINNGYCLRVQNLGDDDALYYGPIVGVAEVKLLTLTQGEGGGYVYADNIHADESNFLNTSGNFVFPGAVDQGTDPITGDPIADQYIVDDCFMDKFGTPDAITTKHGDLDEAHYWYVEGNKYFYNTTLTGYTYQDARDFNLTDNDPNVILSGMEKGSRLDIKKIDWLSTHRGGYDCVLENSETSPEKTDDYEFDIEVGGASYWTNHMPRHDAGEDAAHYTIGKTIGSTEDTYLPQFNIKLRDKFDNSGDAKYTNHLDEPEKVKIYLEGEENGQKYEYTITLNIVYLQGPTYEGGVEILNCALPGERIGFSSGGIKIKTPDLMPVTATAWEILPLKEIDTDGNWKWDSDRGVDIPTTQYSEDLTGNLTGWIPALYKQNESNIAYIFTAGGYNFPVMPKQDAPLKQNRMIVVHNYHRMKDVVPQDLQIEAMPSVTDNQAHTTHKAAEAKLYIEDEADLRAFVNYLNMATATYTDGGGIEHVGNEYNIPVGLAGLDVILQNDITLTSALPAITVPFVGNFHGDGYHIDLNNTQATLFGENLVMKDEHNVVIGQGKVYNLGLVGGTIATTGTRTNCYEGTALSLQETEYKYGKKAYDLSHTFTPASDASAYNNYVHNRYANGDYQYATTDRVWSLRTSEPWYGHTETRHDCEHTHDADRWTNGAGDGSNPDVLMHKGKNIPLYDGLQVIANKNIHDAITDAVIATKLGLPENYANDYLFFGQHLDKTNGDPYPVHINPIAKGDADGTKGGNRVYKTSGFYGSASDLGFHYNRDAWALQPTLTAIDFTKIVIPIGIQTDFWGFTAEKDGTPTTPRSFHVDSNADYGDAYSNKSYGHVTQNLLVYRENSYEYEHDATGYTSTPEIYDAIFAEGTYGNGASESEVRYHLLRNTLQSGDTKDHQRSGVFFTDYFHLVDCQDYHAPQDFFVDSRAWYERLPQAYRNAAPYETGSAWEGLCLPFTFVTRVYGEEEGNELSHFYGVPTSEMLSNPAINDCTLHHEYWLAGLAAADDSGVNFARPSTSGDGLFIDNYKQYTWTPYTLNNTYYNSLPNYSSPDEGHYGTRDDANWYASPRTFTSYPHITMATPYLVAFPGEDFYEFDLTDQKVTFEFISPRFDGIIRYPIPATGSSEIDNYTAFLGHPDLTTTVNGHSHVGTYMHVDADASHLGINAAGDAFDVTSGHILPFRTYMTTTSSSVRRIVIRDGGVGDIPQEGEDINISDATEPTLLIYGEGNTIVVESNYDTELRVYTSEGRLARTLNVTNGINRYPDFNPNIYIVGGKKIRLND